jgi:biotin carboxyl carrier protein
VEVGSRVRAGQTLALIEAMKCFSAIAYGGPGLPEEAEVAEIRAADVSEVRHGQVLFVVR